MAKTSSRMSKGKTEEDAIRLKELVAKNIKLYRGKCSLTQDQLGSLAGITGRYVAELEKRSGANLTLESLARLAGVLGVTVVDLVSEEKSAAETRKQSLKFAIELLERYYHDPVEE